MTEEQLARAANILQIPKEDVGKVLSLQTPQMQMFLLQADGERVLHKKSSIPKEAQVLKEDGSVDLNVRELSAEEAEAYQAFRRRRGQWIEEVRTQYLMQKAKEGKIHISLMDKIETNHVMPRLEIRERAEEAFVRGSTMSRIKDKFKEIMTHLFKPTHAEVVAHEMRKRMKHEE